MDAHSQRADADFVAPESSSSDGDAIQIAARVRALRDSVVAPPRLAEPVDVPSSP